MGESFANSIARELSKRDWRLAEPCGEFAAAVGSELRAQGHDPAHAEAILIARMVTRCYSRVLYLACGEKSAARERAYVELKAFLFAHARHLLPKEGEAAQDLTQKALLEILKHYADCKDGDAFLGWCKQILVHAHLDRLRKLSRTHKTPHGKQYTKRVLSLDAIAEQAEADEPRVMTQDALAQVQNVVGAALRAPMLEIFLETLRRCLKKELRVRVLLELYFNDKSFAELAQELALSAVNIQVIKSRALQSLRECVEMKQLYATWYAS